MRLSLLAQSRNTLENLRAAVERKARAGNEISSGVRVSKPSDSPADAAGVVRTRASLAEIAKFRSNLEAARAELRAVDGAMFDAVDALTRAVTLAVQGASDTQDARSRAALAGEIDGVIRHLQSLANTVYDGRYLFGGARDASPPFLEDAGGKIAYLGDDRSRSIRFPDGRPAQISLPGDAVFLTPDQLVGSGRTPALAGPQPSPPVGLGVAFEGDVEAVVAVDLRGFFVASAAPSGAAAGDTVSVNFVSDDGSISESITTAPLAGGENAAALAALLNDQIALNPQLAGKVSFSDESGALKLTVSDAAGTGFSFTASSTGSVVSGLESGGQVGGYSAAEIARALNDAVAQRPELVAAGVSFGILDGEVTLDSDVDLTVSVVDFARGTEFASGLAGVHRIGGADSVNVFGALEQLSEDLKADNRAGVERAVEALQRAVDHVGSSQAFYGSTLSQIEATLETLRQVEVVNQERLSLHRDADLLESIAELQAATSAEQFALQVAARRRQNLLDVLA